MTDHEVITHIGSRQREQIKALLQKADAILVGIGEGLSHAAGLPITDEDFALGFPQLAKGGWHSYQAAETELEAHDPRYWGYWFRRIQALRFRIRRNVVYDDLVALLADKNYFVITGTTDGLCAKSGIDTQRLYTPQGDYAWLQCGRNCHGETFSILPYLKRALPYIDDQLHLPEPLIPRCGHCGAIMIPNVHRDQWFCHAPYAEQKHAMNQWINQSQAGFLLMLEIGVGYTMPNLIRFPFEHLTQDRSQAALIRINTEHPLCTMENQDKAICIGIDAKNVLAELK